MTEAGRRGGRGFAGMSPEKQREIASKGGRAAHTKGTAHEFTPEEARAAGRKGGEAVSRDRAHMAEIGREGGEASGVSRRRSAVTHKPPEQPAEEMKEAGVESEPEMGARSAADPSDVEMGEADSDEEGF